jgi:hypothetical protein
MRLTRPRFTVWRMMFAVAIIGSAIGITIERHERFRRIANRHRAQVPILPAIMPVGMDDKRWRLFQWHLSIARRYELSARYPWLPVAPDSPELAP